jgi:hypothetical protein
MILLPKAWLLRMAEVDTNVSMNREYQLANLFEGYGILYYDSNN